VEPGDAPALAATIGRLAGDAESGQRGRARVLELCSPEAVAGRLREIYERAAGPRDPLAATTAALGDPS
jgi:hypothetical protein